MLPLTKIQKRLFEIVEPAKDNDTLSKVFDFSILSLVFLNILAVILGTVPSIQTEYPNLLYRFEVFSVIIFSVEYIIRVWACIHSKRFSRPFTGRIKYIFTPMAICDLLSILPFYLTFASIDLRFIRIFRLFRIFRVAKVGRYYKSLDIIRKAVVNKKEELLLSTFMMLTLLVVSSSVMYVVEHDVQPKVFTSIPAAMWWAVAALTTVGYGDVYPITPIGKLFGAIIAILGIGMFALPAGIIASSFVEEIERKKKENKTQVCPHCGEKIEED